VQILRILPISLPMTAVSSGIVQLELIANGFDRESLMVVLAAALVNLVLAFTLIPTYGALGTAWTIVAVESVALIAALLIGRRVRHTSRTAASVGK
jgi:PST family polysaccharide transporter